MCHSKELFDVPKPNYLELNLVFPPVMPQISNPLSVRAWIWAPWFCSLKTEVPLKVSLSVASVFHSSEFPFGLLTFRCFSSCIQDIFKRFLSDKTISLCSRWYRCDVPFQWQSFQTLIIVSLLCFPFPTRQDLDLKAFLYSFDLLVIRFLWSSSLLWTVSVLACRTQKRKTSKENKNRCIFNLDI